MLHRQHTFEQFQCYVLNNEFVPLAAVARRLALPVGNVKLGESTGKVHDCDGNYLWLPLKTQCGTEADDNKNTQMLTLCSIYPYNKSKSEADVKSKSRDL